MIYWGTEHVGVAHFIPHSIANSTNCYCNQTVRELSSCLEECGLSVSAISVPYVQNILFYCNEYEESE